MSYINKTNIAGEETIKRFNWTKWAYFRPMNLAFFFITWPIIWWHRFTTEFGVTTKRFVYKKGFIARSTDEIRLEAIESVNVKIGIVGRFLGYGTLTITGRGEKEMSYSSVAGVLSVKRAIDAAKYDTL